MRAAVLADDGLYFTGRDVQPINTKEIQTIIDLLTLAEKYNCAQVWILPGSRLFERLARHHKKLFRIDDAQGWEYQPKELKNMVTGWRHNAIKSRRQILFPGTIDTAGRGTRALSNQWELETIKEPRALLSAIAWIVRRAGVYPSIPTRTARKIVEASISIPLEPCTSDLTIFADHKAPDLDYLREPTGDESKRLYVHGYDKNYMFLSACAIHLGNGNCEARGPGEFKRNMPGIWDATISGGRSDVRAFCELRGCEDIETAGRMWYYTPTLALAQDYGCEIKVNAGYAWSETRKILDEFTNKMRAAVSMRAELSGPELIAAKSLKDTYTHFIGWLARNSGANGQAFWRPDWRSQIVDNAYSRLIRNIIKVKDETGLMPFGVHRDCLFYLSDEPDAARALPAPITGATAQYKHVFTASSGEALKLIGAGYSVGKIATELKRRMKKGGKRAARR